MTRGPGAPATGTAGRKCHPRPEGALHVGPAPGTDLPAIRGVSLVWAAGGPFTLRDVPAGTGGAAAGPLPALPAARAAGAGRRPPPGGDPRGSARQPARPVLELPGATTGGQRHDVPGPLPGTPPLDDPRRQGQGTALPAAAPGRDDGPGAAGRRRRVRPGHRAPAGSTPPPASRFPPRAGAGGPGRSPERPPLCSLSPPS